VYMHFSLHVSGALRTINAFWEERGHDPNTEGLLFAGYSRKGKPHTVWLQWRRSHDDCCDVFLGLEARRPSEVCPKRSGDRYRLRETDLLDFINMIRRDVTGVQARYAFPWDKNLEGLIRLPGRARPTSLTLEVYDEKQQRVMDVTYERQGAS